MGAAEKTGSTPDLLSSAKPERMELLSIASLPIVARRSDEFDSNSNTKSLDILASENALLSCRSKRPDKATPLESKPVMTPDCISGSRAKENASGRSDPGTVVTETAPIDDLFTGVIGRRCESQITVVL